MHVRVHSTLYCMLIDSSIVNSLFVPEVLDSISDLYAKEHQHFIKFEKTVNTQWQQSKVQTHIMHKVKNMCNYFEKRNSSFKGCFC